jgi:hypothetical protein
VASVEITFDDENNLMAYVIDDGFWRSGAQKPIYSRSQTLTQENDLQKENFADFRENSISKNDGPNFNLFSTEISSAISKLLEFQKDTVNYMNQNSIIAIGKIDNLLNFLNDNHSNIVISIQKITETFQLNQDNLKENQSSTEEILKKIIQSFTLLPTLIQEATNKLGNQILNSFQKQHELLKDSNDKTIQNSLQVQFSNTFDSTLVKTSEIHTICNTIKEQIPKLLNIFTKSNQEISFNFQQLFLKLKDDTVQQLIKKIMDKQKEILIQLKLETEDEKNLIEQETNNLNNKMELVRDIILKQFYIQENNINYLKTYLQEVIQKTELKAIREDTTILAERISNEFAIISGDFHTGDDRNEVRKEELTNHLNAIEKKRAITLRRLF